MNLKRGDHICSIYSTSTELTETVAEFLADGLGHQQRCWYVASGDETEAVRNQLQQSGVDVNRAIISQDTVEQLIVYEALLKSLFAGCRAIGLCMYDARRMPLDVIDGAIATHPKVRAGGAYRVNQFYDAGRSRLQPVDSQSVVAKLQQLDPKH